MLRRIETKENIPDFVKGAVDAARAADGLRPPGLQELRPAREDHQVCSGRGATKSPGTNPLLDIALELEKIALEDSYFIDRKLYPNVDFYSGLIYEALGMPMEMFPVMFAIGRTSGWIAQWLEMIEDPEQKIRASAADLHGQARRRLRPDGSAQVARDPGRRGVGWKVTIRTGPRVERERFDVLDAALDAVEARGRELAKTTTTDVGRRAASSSLTPSSRSSRGSSWRVLSAFESPASAPVSTCAATARPRPTSGACSARSSSSAKARARSAPCAALSATPTRRGHEQRRQYDIHLDDKYGSLTLIDIPAEVAAHEPWFSQGTLTSRSTSQSSDLGVIEGGLPLASPR